MIFSGYRGKKLNVCTWEEVASPVGVVQIVHGMVEYAARYDAFARHLNSLGYVVVADDHRGHGHTDEGSLGYCEGDMFEDTLADEGMICDWFREKYAGLPYFLLGFSYGSFLAQAALARFGEKLSGVVIAGSNHKKDFEVYFGSLVANTVCLFGGERKPAKLIESLSFGAYARKFADREWLSCDAENNAAYHADPFCSFTCSYRFYADFFRGLRSLYTREYIAALPKRLPLLLASGEDDPVGDMGKGVKKLFDFFREKAQMQEVTLTLFKGSRHEFLNEKADRAEKWGAVTGFFDAHLDK